MLFRSLEFGDLIAKLKQQLKLTSVVVTHDMRLAKKLADRVVFLHEAKVAFFGTVDEMVRSESEIVRDFLRLDDVSLLDLRDRLGGVSAPPAAPA